MRVQTCRRPACREAWAGVRLGVTVLLLGALLGCRGAGTGETVVELWAMGREGEVVQQLVPAFESRHPGVRVRVQQIPWSAAHEKLLTAYVGGSMPDVFQVGNTWIPELVALGAVAPLDARVAASAAVTAADYFPGILDTNTVDGALYGVPWYVDTRLLFYRRDLLEAAGVAEPPRTWAAWFDAMRRVKARAGPGKYAALLPLDEWQLPVILALQLGAEPLRDGDRYGNFQSPGVRRAFELYLDLFRQELAPRTGAAQVGNLYHDFAEGFFAFYVSGPWNIGEFGRRLPPALREAWATAPMPGPDAGTYPGPSLAGGASLALHAASRRAAPAWQLIEYLSEPAQQVEFYRLTGDLPARRSAWDAAALRANRHAQAFWAQLQALRSTPKIPEWERVAETITRYAEAAVRGTMPAAAALAALDADVDAMLEKRRWMLARREAPR